jgi:type II secretory pathway pseudopilin PulG
MRTKRLNSSAGFNLIEVSIGILLLGVLLVMVINMHDIYQERKLRLENEQRLEVIRQAMSDFFYRNGRYPCRSLFELRHGHPNYGTESTHCASNFHAGGDYVYFGALPVVALGLPYDYVFDVYNNKYTYWITAIQAANYSPGQGRIIIASADENNSYNSVTPVTGDIAALSPAYDFAIVSHGADGKCAFPAHSTSTNYADITSSHGPNFRTAAAPRDSMNCGSESDNRYIAPSQRFKPMRDTEYASADDPVNTSWHFDDSIIYTLNPKENSLWAMSTNSTAAGEILGMISKSAGNVGIGVSSVNPLSAKLEVEDGDMSVTGNVIVDQNVRTNRSISASGEIRANGRITARRFRTGN